MSGSLRYYKETKDQDGETLWWPGGPNGYPFRGTKAPLTTQTEYENLKLVSKARWRLFYLTREEDGKAYRTIREKCANGLYVLVDRERTWDEATENYRIYMEWLEPAYEAMPVEGYKDAVKDLTNADTSSIIVPINRLAGLQSATEGW